MGKDKVFASAIFLKIDMTEATTRIVIEILKTVISVVTLAAYTKPYIIHAIFEK